MNELKETITLYDYWRSSASYRVRIALELAGLCYEKISIDLRVNDQNQEIHLSRNPLGRVPVLVHLDRTICQSRAIISYIEKQADIRFYPEELGANLIAQELVDIIACDIHPVCNLIILQELDRFGGVANRGEWCRKFIHQGLSAFELQCPEPAGKFLFGESPSIVEVYLIPQLYNAERWGVNLLGMEKITSLQASAAEDPRFQKAYPVDEPIHQSVKDGK